MTRNADNPYGAAAVRKGMMHFLTGKAIQVASGIGVMLILVRWLPVAEYAAYITATAFASVMGTLSLFGMDRLVTRYLPEARLKADSKTFRHFLGGVSAIRFLSVSLLALAMLAGWHLFAGFFGLGGLDALKYPIAAFAILHALLLFQTAVMQSLMLQAGLRNSTAVSSILKLGILAALAALGVGLSAAWALWVIVAAESAGVTWMWIAAFRYAKGNTPSMQNEAWQVDRGAMTRFAILNYLTGQAAFPAQTKVLQLVAAATLPPTAVAAFGFITTLAEQLRGYLPMNLFRTMIEPVMIGKHVQRQDMGQLHVMASAVLKMNILLIVPLAIWLSLEGKQIVELLTGGKFGEYAWMLGVIVFGMIFAVQRTLIVIIANAIDRSAALTISTFLASLVVVTLVWMQLDRIGILGLALGEAGFGLLMVVFFVESQRRQGVRYSLDVRFVLRTVLIGSVSALAGYLLQSFIANAPTVIQITAVGALTGFLLYTANMIWKPFTDNERVLIKRLAGKVPIPF